MNIKNFFRDWSNFLAFGIGLIPTILLYVFPADTSVPFFAFILILFLFLLTLWLSIKLFLDSKDKATNPLIPIIECSHGVCICKTNDFIAYDSIVTFYEKNGNYEQLIGYGRVQTIIAGKTAQIEALYSITEIPDLISHVNDNKENILIRPTITMATLNSINNLLEQEVS